MENFNMHVPTKKSKMLELQSIMSKMPLDVCCMMALPEFGLRWSEVSRAVRKARLPMTGASVARVICRHAGPTLQPEEIEYIVSRLRLKLIATQTRTWHVISLSDRVNSDSPATLDRVFASRVRHALARKSSRVEVHTTMLGDLMYASVQLVSDRREGTILYMATPPGLPVALFSSLALNTSIRACVHGLGYKDYANENLYGRDIQSLLRINDRAWNENADHLTHAPQYDPVPVVTNTGIDYTNKLYDEAYVDNIIGPNPPLLTDLKIITTKTFFDPRRLNKQINLTVQLKSEDVAKSLKCWVAKGALAPTSEFFQIFHKLKSNKIDYVGNESD